jgi:hypothetical protein
MLSASTCTGTLRAAVAILIKIATRVRPGPDNPRRFYCAIGWARADEWMRLIGWRPLRQGKLYGFAEVEFTALGLRIAEILVLSGPEGPWAALPGKPELERDGKTVRVGPNGKPVYRGLLSWRSRKLRQAFSERVVGLA